MRRFIAILIVMVLVACADRPADPPELGEQSLALDAKKPFSPPSSSGESSLSLRWAVGDGVIALDPTDPLELWLENHEDELLEVTLAWRSSDWEFGVCSA